MSISEVSRKTWWSKSKIWKITLVGLASLVLLAGTLLTYGYWFLQKSLPMTKGELALDGLTQQVSVWRDANGVPHIEAQNQHDLYLAQGFVVAQDRLFQMDLSRRQASGQLSEVIGDKTIERDKFFLTLGLRRAAEASLPIYSPEAKQVMDWYAQGVNAYIQTAEKEGDLPVEFRILGYHPRPWSPIDSLTIGKYMAFDLGGHWQGEAFRYYLVQNFDQAKALDLFPSYPENAPTIVQTLKANKLDVATCFGTAIISNEANGSNNWVVSGAKSASGKPMLANDPHLSLATPSICMRLILSHRIPILMELSLQAFQASS